MRTIGTGSVRVVGAGGQTNGGDLESGNGSLVAAVCCCAYVIRPFDGASVCCQDGCSRNRSLRKEVVMIAATNTGVVPMRVSKAVWVHDGEANAHFMVLDELDGDRHLVIPICQAQAF